MRSPHAAAEIHHLVDALDEQLAALPDCALGDELVDMRSAIDRLECVFAHTLRRFDRSREYSSAGAVSTIAWLRWKCHLSTGAASARMAIARTIEHLPQTEAAFARGDLGVQHVTHVARTAEQIGCDAVREHEGILLNAAKYLDPNRFSLVTRHLRHCADPDGALDDANDAHEVRRLHLSHTIDGVYVVDGLLDSEGGAMLQSALNALSAPLPRDERSAAQRRADALVEVCRRQLDAGDLPAAGGQRPHLTLTASIDTLRGEPGHPPADVQWGLPVPGETARRIACDAAAAMVVLDAQGAPIGAGRSTRVIPPALRRALVVRDGGCTFPGCDRPPDWTDAHHLEHWADGGPTDLANLTLLCRRHHRMVHEEGWRLARGDGRMIAIPPDRFKRRAA